MRGRTAQLVFLALLALACSGSTTETVIGPAGGIVEASGVQLIIPANALRVNTPIRISQISVGPEAEWDALSAVFEFQPAGTRFDVPATVRFETRRFDERALVVWQSIGSTDPLTPTWEGAWASAAISHFSTGFVGVPASELDASIDAGVDAAESEPDAAPDGEVDAAPDAADGGLVAIPDLECWMDELVPGATSGSNFIVGPGERIAFLTASDGMGGVDVMERVDGAWMRTNLLELIDASATLHQVALTQDDTGRLHAVAVVMHRWREFHAYHLARDASWSVTPLTADPLPCRFPSKTSIASVGGEVNIILECGLGDYSYVPLHCTNRGGTWSCAFVPDIERNRVEITSELMAAPDGRFFILEMHAHFSEFAVWADGVWSGRQDIGERCDYAEGCPAVGGAGGSMLMAGSDPVFYTILEGLDCSPFPSPECMWPPVFIRRSQFVGGHLVTTIIAEGPERLTSNAVIRGSDEYVLIGVPSDLVTPRAHRIYHHGPGGARFGRFPFAAVTQELRADRERLYALMNMGEELRIATTCP